MEERSDIARTLPSVAADFVTAGCYKEREKERKRKREKEREREREREREKEQRDSPGKRTAALHNTYNYAHPGFHLSYK